MTVNIIMYFIRNSTIEKLNYLNVKSTGKPANIHQNEHPDWTPTINLSYINTNASTKSKVDRYYRAQKRIVLSEISQQPLKNVSSIYRKQKNPKTAVSCKQLKSYIHLDHTYHTQTALQSQNNKISSTLNKLLTFEQDDLSSVDCYQSISVVSNVDLSFQKHLHIEDSNMLQSERSIKPHNECELNNLPDQPVCFNDMSVQTDSIEIDECENCNRQENIIKNLETSAELSLNEISELKALLKKKKMDLDFIRRSNKICRYITGVSSYEVVEIIYNMVHADLPTSPRNVISKEEIFVMTLKRLRLGHQLHTLALENDISLKTTSKYFSATLFVLYKKLSIFINWPCRSVLQNHMPKNFNLIYGSKVTIIIDCFEIRMEKPSTMLGACSVWSNYKHHNTVKVNFLQL